MKKTLALLCLGLLVLGVCVPPAGAAAIGDLSYGADLRYRQTSFEDVPLRNGGAIGFWSFFRIRPRVWAQYQISDNMLVRAMVTNEFRKWMEPEHRASYKFPDEVLVDNLYLDMKSLAGNRLDLRIGRQNLIYGTGKIILDGTPGDGSRTIYLDAVKATWKGFANMSVDLLGIYDFAENPLAVNASKLNLTNLTPADVDREANELGLGVYAKHKGLRGVPFEAYYLYKQEAEFTLASGAKNPAVSYSTLGARLMPKLSGNLTGNLELAYQMGSADNIDLSGYMVDAKVTMAMPAMGRVKPTTSVGLYLLSGNDPGTADKDEAWRPPFSRWPQYSELYIYSYAADRGSVADWQNVMMPYVECGTVLADNLSSTALLGYMTAMQDDGPGDGKARGLLFTWWNKFNIAKGLLREKDSLAGHLLIEAVRPGNYYVSKTASQFYRWELVYTIQ
ncbi:MAG: alginate export family protein [Gemmatimonadota bacterium]